MYWNSSTGESGPEATALRPSNRECFLVMRRSLFLMAATILSSEPWCVLIEYRWQPGTEVEETQMKRHYLRRVATWRCPNDGCRQPVQRSYHLVFHTIHGLFKINLKAMNGLNGAIMKVTIIYWFTLFSLNYKSACMLVKGDIVATRHQQHRPVF